MVKKLSGKTALITGAGRGVGRATAILFARHGAALILVARTRAELESTAAICRQENVKVAPESEDLARKDQIDLLFEKINPQFPRIDILINNAAMFDRGLVTEYPIDRFELLFRTNVLAPFYLAQKIIPRMDRERGGAIVNISSYSGCFGVEKFPGFGAYNISKYALWGLTEILALENENRGIRANQISLSGVDTRMFHEASPPGVKADLTLEEVTEEILFLASDDSAPMTGQNVMMPELPLRND